MSKKNKAYDIDSIKLNFDSEDDKRAVEEYDKKNKAKLDKNDLLLKNTKVSVTLRLDADILENIKEYAKKENLKYQSLINGILRKKFGDENYGTNSSKSKIENEMRQMQKRVEAQDELINELLARMSKIEKAS